MKITLLQQPLVWMDGPANLRHFDRQLEEVSGRDIIVLPEMFTTGFAMEAAKQSMPQEEVVEWMQAKAEQTNAMIAGSAALQTERGPVNRFLLVEPGGKTHFTISVTCSAWRMSITIMRQVLSEWSLNGAAGGFCRWCVMTCVSRYGRVTTTITIWRCMLLTGLPAFAALAIAAGRQSY